MAEMPAPIAETAEVSAPPMATLWKVANRLPAATLPILACHVAAAVPRYSHSVIYEEWSLRE